MTSSQRATFTVTLPTFLFLVATLSSQTSGQTRTHRNDTPASVVEYFSTIKTNEIDVSDIAAAKFVPNSNRVLLIHRDSNHTNYLTNWNIVTRSLEGSSVAAHAPLAVSNDGKICATVSHYEDSELVVAVRDTESLRLIRNLNCGKISLVGDRPLAILGDNKTVAAMANRGRVLGLRLDTGMTKFGFPCAPEEHQSGILAVDPQGKTLAAFGDDDLVCVWSLETFRKLVALPIKDNHTICSISYSRDGKLLSYGTINGRVEVWNVAETDRKYVIDGDSGDTKSTPCAAFDMYRDLLIVASKKSIRFYDSTRGALLHQVNIEPKDLPFDNIQSLEIAPDGRTLLITIAEKRAFYVTARVSAK